MHLTENFNNEYISCYEFYIYSPDSWISISSATKFSLDLSRPDIFDAYIGSLNAHFFLFDLLIIDFD